MRNKTKHASPFRWMLRRYVFLAVAAVIIAFAVFPMQGMMRILSANQTVARWGAEIPASERAYLARQLSLEFVYSPLNLEMLCLLFGGMGFGAALVLFRHLFSRKQGMLIAGLPVTRQKGFLLRLGVYVIWCMIPLAVCMAIYPAAVWMNGLRGYFSLRLYILRCGATLLISLYGFALGALCASLFGTFWSAALGGALLAGSAEVTLICWIRFAACYLGTLYVNRTTRDMLSASPVYSMYKCFYRPDQTGPWPGLAAAAVFLILGYFAYQKVYPENAGHTLNQKKLEPAVTAWMTVLGGTAGALVLSLYLGREAMMYLGLCLGAAAAWLLTRMLLDQRIHISLRRWMVPAAVTAAMLCAMLGLRMDIFGYNTWAPEAAKLRMVRIQPDMSEREEMRFQDPEGIEASLRWVEQARQELLETREKRPFDMSIVRRAAVIFEDQNGRTVYRQYDFPADKAELVPALQIMAKKYAAQQREEIPRLKNAFCYSAFSTYNIDASEFLDTFGFYPRNERFSMLDAEKAREALRRDLAERTLESMQAPAMLNLYFEGRDEDTGEYDYSEYVYRITAADRHTLALILGGDAEKWIDYIEGGFARSPQIRVFLCEYEDVGEERQLRSYRMAESEEQVREWMKQASRYDSALFSWPTDRDRQVVIYSLENLRDQISYGEMDCDLEDPEVLRTLPEIPGAWGTSYPLIASDVLRSQ